MNNLKANYESTQGTSFRKFHAPFLFFRFVFSCFWEIRAIFREFMFRIWDQHVAECGSFREFSSGSDVVPGSLWGIFPYPEIVTTPSWGFRPKVKLALSSLLIATKLPFSDIVTVHKMICGTECEVHEFLCMKNHFMQNTPLTHTRSHPIIILHQSSETGN